MTSSDVESDEWVLFNGSLLSPASPQLRIEAFPSHNNCPHTELTSDNCSQTNLSRDDCPRSELERDNCAQTELERDNGAQAKVEPPALLRSSLVSASALRCVLGATEVHVFDGKIWPSGKSLRFGAKSAPVAVAVHAACRLLVTKRFWSHPLRFFFSFDFVIAFCNYFYFCFRFCFCFYLFF